MQSTRTSRSLRIALAALAFAAASAVLSAPAHPAQAATARPSARSGQAKAALQQQDAGAATAQDVPAAEEQANENKIAAAEALPPDEFSTGRISDVVSRSSRDVGGVTEHLTVYRVILLNGKEKGKEVQVQTSDLDVAMANRTVKEGDTVVIVKSYKLGGDAAYYLADSYRIPALAGIALLFVLAAVAFGRARGFSSMLGLAVTVGIIMWYVVPRITAGGDPLRTSLVATFAIAAVSLYLAHGFNRRTTIAFVSTLVTLGISAWMAVSWVGWASLFGTGSEDAIFLQGSGFGDINLRGLLLGGIMLGVMGILDDITTAQAAVVEELKHANPSLKFAELYKRGLSVGKEHISSLINTLFLAYAGASLPLFLLFTSTKSQPLWYVLNSETIAEEIVRTIVGSVCLILAVPITTVLAASYYSEHRVRQGDAPPLPHHHH